MSLMIDPATDPGRRAARPARVLAFTDPAGMIRWRLVANNGRTLGIAASAHDASLDPAEVLRGLVPALATATRYIAHQHGSPAWTWRIVGAGGRSLACADRTFERYDTCDRSARRFQDFVQGMLRAETLTAADPEQPIFTTNSGTA